MNEENIIKNILGRLKEHHIESFSSQIAFYLLLSIFPFLILLFMFLTQLSVSSSEGMLYIYNVIPDEAAQLIKDYLEYSSQFSNSVFSPLLIVSIWMSSNAIIALMKAVNVAYDIEETRIYILRKVIAIICTLMTLLLVVVAIIVPNLGLVVMRYIRQYIEIPEMSVYLFNVLRLLISGFVFFFVLGSLYFILPNKKVKLKEVIPGTVFAFIGLVTISYLFSYFVQDFSQYSIVYGSLAAVIILMIWLFLCGMILMLGGELNAIKYQKMKENL